MASVVIGAILILVSSMGCTRNPEDPGIEIFPDMVHSQAVEAYSESPITKDGKSMREPPKNSIARGFKPFEYGPGDSEARRAGRDLVNPYPPNEINLARGKVIYDNYCLICHGEKGKGDGPLIPKFPNPPSFTSKTLMKYEDGRLYHIIVHGAGVMPSHAAQIKEKDRWFLVNYIRELQSKKGTGK